MYLHQTDLLHRMDRHFLKDFLAMSERREFEAGDFIFRRGNKADYFNILMRGHVRLISGVTGHIIHTIDHPGEAFGWSSLVGRNTYSASAECIVPTKLLRIEGKQAMRVFDKHPFSGIIFYRRLAAILGKRLIQGYEELAGIPEAEAAISFGSRQVMDMPELMA